MAIGHVRYSTTGETILRNVQPLFSELNAGGFAVGHNGNLTNGLTLRRQLVRDGAIMQSTTDTEVILHLLARSTRDRFIDRFIEALRQIEGAYSLVALTNKKLIGARDPLGIRPLVLGELDGCPIVTSETCALDIIGARYVRDVENGEIVVFSEEGAQSLKPFPPMRAAALHLRIHLFRPARLGRRRPQRLPDPPQHGHRARRRGAGRRRRRGAGAGLRRAGGDRLSRRPPASPTSSASSATTMSAAPSSSRPSRSASSACASSTMPTARWSPASASC